MTRDGLHRRSVSLSGPIHRTLSSWAYVGDIAVSAALEIAIRQWHGRIAPGVIEEWVAAGAGRSVGLRRAPGESPRRMVSVGRDAFRILEIRSEELGISKSLLAEFCAVCRVQRAISYQEVLDHVDATDRRTEGARTAHLERRASAKMARLEQTVDARTERTIALRRRRAIEARVFEERLERARREYLERDHGGDHGYAHRDERSGSKK